MLLYIVSALIILLGITIYIYNKLVSKAEAVDNSKMQIDIQLDRRFKVFENLIAIVQKSMDYEQTVLKEIVQLRSHAQSSKAKGDMKSQFEAEEKISKIANVVFESYPELKVLSNMAELQEEVSSTENKLAFAKQAYNNAIESYNITKRSFFGSIVASIFKSKVYFIYDYWQLPKSKAQAYEVATLKL
jgi:LemA protein